MRPPITLLILALLLLNSFILTGERSFFPIETLPISEDGVFEVNVLSTSSVTECTGSVQLLAEGSAGPFTVTIVETEQQLEQGTEWTVENICAGDYTVLFETADGCTFERFFTILACPEIAVAVGFYQSVEPTSCETDDGYIQFRGAHRATPSSSYSFHIEKNGELIPKNTSGHYSNLYSGEYCLVATDLFSGCTGESCFVLDHQENIHELDWNSLPACGNSPSGFLELSVFYPTNEDQLYNFAWSNGFSESNTTYSLNTGLSPGIYSVTVTSTGNASNCELISEYEVESENLQTSPLTLTAQTSNPCPDSENGRIKVITSGDQGPYEILWNDGQDFDFNRTGLSSGDYCYTVTGRCHEATGCNTISSMESSISTNPGCEIGSVNVTVSNGTPPYTYRWLASDGSTYTTPNLVDVESDQYALTISDRRGCTETHNVELLNQDFESDVEEPCDGFADGVVTLFIDNPFEEAVIITINGATVNYPNASRAIQHSIADVAAGSLDVTVNIGGCIVEKSISVSEAPFRRELVEVTDDLCVFDQFCKDEPLGEEARHTQFIEWDVFNPEGTAAFGRCGFPGLCGGEEVAFRNVRKRTLRLGELEILRSIVDGCGLPNFGSMFDNESNPCRKVRFCPATMVITGQYPTLGGNLDIQSDGNGCFATAGCGLFGLSRGTFCPDEYLDEASLAACGAITNPGGSDPLDFSNCDPVSFNIRELISWDQEGLLRSNFENYDGSQLQAQLHQWRTGPEFAKTACATVTFCSSNFFVLSNTLFQVNNCGLVLNQDGQQRTLCEMEQSNSNSPQFHVVCERACRPFESNCPGNVPCICFDYKLIVLGEESFDVDNFKSIGGKIRRKSNNVLFLDENVSPIALTYATILADGVKHPIPMIREENGNSVLSYGGSDNMDFEFLGNTVNFIDDMDSDAIYQLNEIVPDRTFEVRIFTTEKSYSIPVASTGSFIPTYLDLHEDVLIIGGEAKGTVSTHGLKRGKLSQGAALIKLSASNGKMLSFEVFDKMKNVNFSSNLNGGAVTFTPYTSSVVVSNQSVKLIADREYHKNIFKDRQNSTLEENLWANKNNNLLHVSSSPTRTLSLLRINDEVIGRSGKLLRPVPNNSGESFSLISTPLDGMRDEQKDLFYKKVFITGSKNVSFASATDIDGKEIGLSLTFSNSITVNNVKFTSQGANDALLLIINNDGTILQKFTFGGAGDQNVNDFVFLGAGFYVLGHFDGLSKPFKFGPKSIIPTGNQDKVPFVFPLTSPEFEPFGKQEASIQKTADQLTEHKLKVSPVPATDRIWVSLTGNNPETQVNSLIKKVKLMDVSGKVVLSRTISSNKFEILLPKLETGIYFLTAIDESGNSFQTKVMVK